MEPLAAHIGKLVRAGPALFADDTPVKMQAKGKAQTARLWSYVRDERMVRTSATLCVVSVQCGPQRRASLIPSQRVWGRGAC